MWVHHAFSGSRAVNARSRGRADSSTLWRPWRIYRPERRIRTTGRAKVRVGRLLVKVEPPSMAQPKDKRFVWPYGQEIFDFGIALPEASNSVHWDSRRRRCCQSGTCIERTLAPAEAAWIRLYGAGPLGLLPVRRTARRAIRLDFASSGSQRNRHPPPNGCIGRQGQSSASQVALQHLIRQCR